MARLLIQVEDPLSLSPGHSDQPRMLIGSYVRVEIQGNAVASAAAIERKFIRNGNTAGQTATREPASQGGQS